MREPGSPIPPPTGPPSYTPQSAVNGTLILVLGILGVVLCQILGPVAWVMGNNALQTLDTGGGDQSQRQLVTIGRILGIIGTVLLILSILWIVFVVGLGVFGAVSGGAGVRR
jgi:uncharacterized membrane protein YjgN (DUF898 family)